MIAATSVQEVQERADIVEVVGQFVRLKKRGSNYIGNCPFHSEKTPSFSVSPSRGIYKCFGCGKAGNSVTFIQEHEKLTFPEAIRWLADYYKITLEETQASPERIQQHQTEESLRILNEFAAKFFQKTLLDTDEGRAIGQSYFKERGFRKEIIERFFLGYSSEDGNAFLKYATDNGYSTDLLEKAGLVKERNGMRYDSYRGRVIFPIQNMTGRVLGFGARIIKKNDRAPKYVNSPENELYIKSKVLYGMFQSRRSIAKEDECFLVEGYTDVISLHQGGVENVLASSGTSLTEDQLRLISQLTKNLTILYDGDAAGIKAALRGLDMALAQSFNVKLVLLPEGEDPDSFIQKNGAARFYEYVKEHKQDVISFRLEVGLKDAGNDPVAKSKLVNEIAESIAKINKAEDFSLQHHYIKETSRKLELDEAALINLVNKYIRDKIEQEKRHQRRDDTVLPEPQVISPETEVIGPADINDNNEEQELELLRVLIVHGEKAYEGFNNIADMLYQRVDAELFENAFVRQVYEEYFNYLHQYTLPPNEAYFINHTDEKIRIAMASLLHNNTDISPNWSKNYGIETLNGDLNYINEADSALSYFELKNILKIQEELTRRFVGETDANKIAFLQQRFLELRKAENEIVRKHGTTVFKILKR